MIRQSCILLCIFAVTSTAHGADSVRVDGADEWRVQAAKVRFAARQVAKAHSANALLITDDTVASNISDKVFMEIMKVRDKYKS